MISKGEDTARQRCPMGEEDLMLYHKGLHGQMERTSAKRVKKSDVGPQRNGIADARSVWRQMMYPMGMGWLEVA